MAPGLHRYTGEKPIDGDRSWACVFYFINKMASLWSQQWHLFTESRFRPTGSIPPRSLLFNSWASYLTQMLGTMWLENHIHTAHTL